MKKLVEEWSREGCVVGFWKMNRAYSLLELDAGENGEGCSPIYLDTPRGHAFYEKSLILLFAAAVRTLYPHAEINVEHTIDTGLYFTLSDRSFPILKMEHVARIKEKMEELAEADLPFTLYRDLPRKEMLS